jgi:hypothetical protein
MTTRTHETTAKFSTARPALSAPGGAAEMFLANPDELAAALAADGVAA